jgi:hypothetical protein
MSIGYIYYGANCEVGPVQMAEKIQRQVGVAPERTHFCSEYFYVVFASALSDGAKADLDDFFVARGGSFKSIDLAPEGVVCIGASSDSSVWKFVLDNQGVITTSKPVTE